MRWFERGVSALIQSILALFMIIKSGHVKGINILTYLARYDHFAANKKTAAFANKASLKNLEKMAYLAASSEARN